MKFLSKISSSMKIILDFVFYSNPCLMTNSMYFINMKGQQVTIFFVDESKHVKVCACVNK